MCGASFPSSPINHQVGYGLLACRRSVRFLPDTAPPSDHGLPRLEAARQASLRCLLVHDQRFYQEMLAARLTRLPGLEIVGFGSCAATAIKACSEAIPDLLVLDLWHRDQDLALVIRAFAVLNPKGRVIFFTEDPDSVWFDPDLQPVIAASLGRSSTVQDLLNVISDLRPDLHIPAASVVLDSLTSREL